MSGGSSTSGMGVNAPRGLTGGPFLSMPPIPGETREN